MNISETSTNGETIADNSAEVKQVDNQNERLEKGNDAINNVEFNEPVPARIPNGVAPKAANFQLVHSNSEPNGFENNLGVQYRRSRPISRTASYLESKSPGYVNSRLVNYNRGVSYQPSIYSHSQFQPEPENIPPPTTEKEKSKMTRRYFSTISGISYAIFLVIFAGIVFVGSAVENRRPIPEIGTLYPIAEIFCIFMLSLGFFYFLFLYIDIRLHISKAQQAVKDKENRAKMFEEQLARAEAHIQNSMEYSQTSNNNINIQIPLPELSAPIQPVSHRYCFMTGRHGEFLYLKMGAAWFCFGLLTHSILTITYEVVYLAEDSGCSNILQLTVDIMFPLYSLFLLFFIFKYCNVVINTYRGFSRLMLMHAIGTSLSFWIYTIVRETQDAINLKYYRKLQDKNITESDPSVRIDKMNTEWFTPECPGRSDLNLIYRNFAPYLYPFIIEFCILIVGIFYMMWANISHCPRKHSASGHGHGNHDSLHQNHHSESSLASLASIPENGHLQLNGVVTHHAPSSEVSDHCKNLFEHENQYKSNLVVYADCHAASRGLFGGMILMILTIVFIILLHVAVNEPNYIDTGVTIDRSFELAVLVILIVTVAAAYFQTSKLDINLHPISKLDDVLLFIAIPAFFSETIFSMLPAIINGSYLTVAVIIAQIVQVLIQTPWIIDALRRCANSVELRKKKPGRELVTFLTVANVSLWIYYTFSVKNADVQDERYKFYGDTLWSILNHLSLPLIMFYRFHASVCLVDIWRHSYEPGEFAH